MVLRRQDVLLIKPIADSSGRRQSRAALARLHDILRLAKIRSDQINVFRHEPQ
jgi:hypothetical protein